MLNTTDKIIRYKTGLLNLADELSNVSTTCQIARVRSILMVSSRTVGVL